MMKDYEMDNQLLKVLFHVDDRDWHGHSHERLWAKMLDDSPYRSVLELRNSPFFVRGVSFLDIIQARQTSKGAGLEFAQVLRHSGHSTYMLLVPQASHDFPSYMTSLEKIGCSYESKTQDTKQGKRVLYSVDVPPTADIYTIYAILEDGEKKNIWIFQEGHVGHKLKGRNDR